MFDKLIDLFVSFLHLFQFFFVTDCYQNGVVLRFGHMNRLAPPGFHWLWPFNIEKHISVSVVPETMIVGPQSLTTNDGCSVIVSTVVTFSVSDAPKFLLEVEGAHQVIEDSTYGQVATFIMGRSWKELMEVNLSRELCKAVRSQAKRYGVEILNVQVCDFTRSRSLRLMQQFSHRSHGA